MKLDYPVFLLSLLWSLVEVHSQTEYPYVSFMGKNLLNHSYVDLTLLGEDDTDVTGNVVRCITDLTTCCHTAQGDRRGDWYFPDGGVLSWNGAIYRNRDNRRVNLRRTNNAMGPSGIYRCEVPTVAVHNDNDLSVRETVYVGLYPPSGGMFITTHFITSYVIASLVLFDDNPFKNHINRCLYIGLKDAYLYRLKTQIKICIKIIIGSITIPSGVTLTVDSDLNGASPQFTLTCISTGGPATTVTWTRDSVTWTRDSVTVTEGTETVLDDPVTAQYTHTLTVTGKLPGLYTCTVANRKPSSYSSSYFVELEGIQLTTITHYTAIKLATACIIIHICTSCHLLALFRSFTSH